MVLDDAESGAYYLGMSPNRLRELRKAADISEEKLASLAGTSQPQINRLETGQRRLTKKWAKKLAPHLGVEWQDLHPDDEPPVRIVGYVRSGAEAIFYSEGSEDFGEAPRPAGAPDTTVAVVVRGESMVGSADDGWLLYYDERHNPPPEFVDPRALYVCGLADGRVVVKKLRRGSSERHYHLLSTSRPDEPEFDVLVEWAAHVTWIKPA